MSDEDVVRRCKVEEEVTCSVCRDDLRPGEDAARLECDHLFHLGCITPWLERSDTCPVCRRRLWHWTEPEPEDEPWEALGEDSFSDADSGLAFVEDADDMGMTIELEDFDEDLNEMTIDLEDLDEDINEMTIDLEDFDEDDDDVTGMSQDSFFSVGVQFAPQDWEDSTTDIYFNIVDISSSSSISDISLSSLLDSDSAQL